MLKRILCVAVLKLQICQSCLFHRRLWGKMSCIQIGVTMICRKQSWSAFSPLRVSQDSAKSHFHASTDWQMHVLWSSRAVIWIPLMSVDIWFLVWLWFHFSFLFHVYRQEIYSLIFYIPLCQHFSELFLRNVIVWNYRSWQGNYTHLVTLAIMPLFRHHAFVNISLLIMHFFPYGCAVCVW